MPPPFCPVTYGKRHTLPIPIAHPALTSINPRRDLNDSLFIYISPIVIALRYHPAVSIDYCFVLYYSPQRLAAPLLPVHPSDREYLY